MANRFEQLQNNDGASLGDNASFVPKYEQLQRVVNEGPPANVTPENIDSSENPSHQNILHSRNSLSYEKIHSSEAGFMAPDPKKLIEVYELHKKVQEMEKQPNIEESDEYLDLKKTLNGIYAWGEPDVPPELIAPKKPEMSADEEKKLEFESKVDWIAEGYKRDIPFLRYFFYVRDSAKLEVREGRRKFINEIREKRKGNIVGRTMNWAGKFLERLDDRFGIAQWPEVQDRVRREKIKKIIKREKTPVGRLINKAAKFWAHFTAGDDEDYY